MRNTPNDCSDDTINALVDGEPGPLARLFRGLGIDDKLPPIQTPKRITEAPVKVGTPISRDTPRELECPTCRVFEIEVGTELCPRCNRIAANRSHAAEREQFRAKSIRLEVAARKLDELDPDWPDKFLTTEEAMRFYREELEEPKPRASRVIFSSPFEPNEYADDRRDTGDDE
jgi:hypothetical protein